MTFYTKVLQYQEVTLLMQPSQNQAVFAHFKKTTVLAQNLR